VIKFKTHEKQCYTMYLMHYSRARSLKWDGRDHSPSRKQPLARGSQPAASWWTVIPAVERQWSRSAIVY